MQPIFAVHYKIIVIWKVVKVSIASLHKVLFIVFRLLFWFVCTGLDVFV